ncbi:MAG: hypothetical protein AB7F28_03245 [Candidatus Margulisiibacteriota bacterium]
MAFSISLKLAPDILKQTEEITHHLHLSRNAYINEAVSYYNHINQEKLLKKQLSRESKWVGRQSMEVLKEFEALEE